MKKYRPHITRRAFFIAAAVLLLATGSIFVMNDKNSSDSVVVTANAIYDALDGSHVLSTADRAAYKTAFAAQKAGDWQTADTALEQVQQRVLHGYVLAERYLSHRYQPTATQLSKWLTEHRDLPQAWRVYELASNEYPSLRNTLKPIEKPRLLSGYGDDQSTSGRFEQSGYYSQWQSGLDSWRLSDARSAAKLFSPIADAHQNLTSWQKSAAAFWAYRSHKASGNTSEATKYLRLAAEEPRSFYGIIARQKLKKSLDIDTQSPSLSHYAFREMIADPAIARVVALSEIGMVDAADKEMRALFPKASADEKIQLLALAQRLDLSAVEITMARHLRTDDNPLDSALYPLPEWEPKDGFTVDPALIYALSRQESGFRTNAVSGSGALGLMQLMPKTATMMKKQSNLHTQYSLKDVSQSELNVTLGQDYLEHLLKNPLVKGNLFYLLAAYNAGAGRLQEWKARIDHRDDPLLFIESIPFSETRYHVMQVMTNYWIYSEMLGNDSASLMHLARGDWPLYAG